jgi:hypothetical protein
MKSVVQVRGAAIEEPPDRGSRLQPVLLRGDTQLKTWLNVRATPSVVAWALVGWGATASCGPAGTAPSLAADAGGNGATDAAGREEVPGREDGGPRDATPDPNDASVSRPAPVFLPSADYADVLTIDPAFPFGVVARIAADDLVVGARWGNHGGPLVTIQDVFSRPDTVLRYTVPSPASSGKATSVALPVARPTALPGGTVTWGPDGLVDLPSGNLAVRTFQSCGVSCATGPSEAFLYAKNYDAVAARAPALRAFSVAPIRANAFVFSAFGPLERLSETPEPGLYTAELCTYPLGSSLSCKPSTKLFGWPGNENVTNPALVAVDTQGNAFVDATLPQHDVFLGAAAADVSTLRASAPVELATIPGVTSSLRSFAAISPEGASPGLLVAVYGFGTDSYAQAYAVPLASAGAKLVRPLTRGSAARDCSVFSSPINDLWVAVELRDPKAGTPRSYFLQLRRKP